MNKTILTEDELQHIEHCNKILREHSKLVEDTVNNTQELLNLYLPALSAYVSGISKVQVELGKEVVNLIQSTRQIKIVVSNTQEITNFISAVVKLNDILTPELIEKLKKISK